MGDPVCYRTFCPVCDGPITVTDETCPDCGASVPDQPDPSA